MENQGELLKHLDLILLSIINKGRILIGLEQECNKKIAEIQNNYYRRINNISKSIADAEADLLTLGLQRRETLFAAADRVDLPHGALLLKTQEKIKKIRTALERLKELGWREAIVISESVNWDLVSHWPDDKLAQLGTARTKKETIEYELNAAKPCENQSKSESKEN